MTSANEIRIKTGIDTSEINEKIAELKNNLEQLSKGLKSDEIKKSISDLDKEYEKINSRLKEIDDTRLEMDKKLQEIGNTFGFNSTAYQQAEESFKKQYDILNAEEQKLIELSIQKEQQRSILDGQLQNELNLEQVKRQEIENQIATLEKQKALLASIQAERTSNELKNKSLTEEEYQRNIDLLRQSVEEVEKLGGNNQAVIELIKQEIELQERLKNGVADTNKEQTRGTKAHSKGLLGIIGSTKRLVLSLIGAQSVYTAIRKIISAATSDNEKLSNTINAFWAGLGAMFEPVINSAIQGLATIMSYLLSIMSTLTGINLLAKANKKLQKNNSGSKSSKLASFDKSEVIKKDSGQTNDPTDNYLKQIELAGQLEDFIERIKNITSEWWNSLNFEPLMESINRFKEAISPLIEKISDGLLWIYENILLPIGTWFIESRIPADLEVISSILGVVNDALDKLLPILEELWVTYLQPFFNEIGEGVVEILEHCAHWIGENEDTLGTVLAVILAIVAAIAAFNVVMAIAEVLAGAPWILIVAGIMLVIAILDMLGISLEDIMIFICNVGIFIVNVLIGVVQAFVIAIRGIIKLVLVVVQSVVNLIIDGINLLIDGLNLIGGLIGHRIDRIKKVTWADDFEIVPASFDSWFIPYMSKQSGATTSKAASKGHGEIAAFAQGGVFQPNSPFLGILGDQTRGRNIEAPEDLIRQIVKEESGGKNITLNITADSTSSEFVRWLKFELDEETNRKGISLVKG
ncbi:MAG: hypothetical protein IJH31_01825 [Erysipelotrichaceae bacterium]|nr:hypothetical protein [Erysipelotrichaceae bacterium]